MSLVLALLSAAGTGVWLGWYIRRQLAADLEQQP